MTGQPDTCLVSHCPEEPVRDALYCRGHLADFWAGRLRKLSDGSVVYTAGPQPRWLARQADPEGEGATLGLGAKDLTGWAASG